jgi:CDP-glucose 4,6-dehydratase
MENMVENFFWADKKVFITGHTGFKGSWLSQWLISYGAEVHGFSLAPQKQQKLFKSLNLGNLLASNTYGDIRNYNQIHKALAYSQPDIIFHLAAQPLVKESYLSPLETLEVNALGTANILEALKTSRATKVLINVTTDKCYENEEINKLYSESDKLGGHDIYSASKACSEIITSAYNRSFFYDKDQYIASARAGNVIGGGDYSADRLIPDLFRAIDGNKTLLIRNPLAIRPWQHVLEPLSGYLELAKNLFLDGPNFEGPWNFGPNEKDCISVQSLLKIAAKKIDFSWEVNTDITPHEATLLMLDNSKAKKLLSWNPRLSIEDSVQFTVDWHEKTNQTKDLQGFMLSQIEDFLALSNFA